MSKDMSLDDWKKLIDKYINDPKNEFAKFRFSPLCIELRAYKGNTEYGLTLKKPSYATLPYFTLKYFKVDRYGDHKIINEATLDDDSYVNMHLYYYKAIMKAVEAKGWNDSWL